MAMKLAICVMRDSAAQTFGVPQFQVSKGTALRAFGDEVNRQAQDNAFFTHPEDFELYYLGVYDDQKSSFELVPEPELLARGQDLKR